VIQYRCHATRSKTRVHGPLLAQYYHPHVISACTLTHTGTFGLAALTFATVNTAGGVILHAIDFELATQVIEPEGPL
jgi:hypothetical protein